jgi:hypothetical protein
VLGTFLIEVISYVLADQDQIKQYWPVILGLVLLVVVVFKPTGILGFFVSERERIGSYGGPQGDRRVRGRGTGVGDQGGQSDRRANSDRGGQADRRERNPDTGQAARPDPADRAEQGLPGSQGSHSASR